MKAAFGKRCLLSAAAIAAVYFCNRLWLLPHTSGTFHRLLAWYFGDFLAGALMLCILNGSLAMGNRPALKGILPVSIFLAGCGLFWEVVTPLYLSRSVSDPWDVAAVWLGGMGMLAFFSIMEHR